MGPERGIVAFPHISNECRTNLEAVVFLYVM